MKRATTDYTGIAACHNHHPTWRKAMVYLSHYNGTRTHSDVYHIERRVVL